VQMAAFLCYTIAKTDEFVSSRYMEPDELSVQDSLPGARVQRGAGRLRRRRYFEAPTEPTGETSSLQGARVKPLPSDMMLCVISYWVYIIWCKMAADPAAPLLRFSTPSC